MGVSDLCEECLASLDQRKIKAPTEGEVREFKIKIFS